jgi:hypothetical protein
MLPTFMMLLLPCASTGATWLNAQQHTADIDGEKLVDGRGRAVPASGPH